MSDKIFIASLEKQLEILGEMGGVKTVEGTKLRAVTTLGLTEMHKNYEVAGIARGSASDSVNLYTIFSDKVIRAINPQLELVGTKTISNIGELERVYIDSSIFLIATRPEINNYRMAIRLDRNTLQEISRPKGNILNATNDVYTSIYDDNIIQVKKTPSDSIIEFFKYYGDGVSDSTRKAIHCSDYTGSSNFGSTNLVDNDTHIFLSGGQIIGILAIDKSDFSITKSNYPYRITSQPVFAYKDWVYFLSSGKLIVVNHTTMSTNYQEINIFPFLNFGTSFKPTKIEGGLLHGQWLYTTDETGKITGRKEFPHPGNFNYFNGVDFTTLGSTSVINSLTHNIMAYKEVE